MKRSRKADGRTMTETDFKVVIPARYGSSRLPGKPLLKIAVLLLGRQE